jgi:hypothetical protein
MSNLQQEAVKLILDALKSTNLTIESFVIMAISTEECGMNPLSRSFLDGGMEKLLDNLLQNGLICSTVSNWVISQAMKIYKKEMSNLTSKENGFHFLTAKMTQEQLQSFDVEDIMKRIMVIAPDLWRLMETLHAADSRVNYQRTWTQKRSKKVREATGEDGYKRNGPEGDIEMADVQLEPVWELDDEEDEYWKTIDVNEFGLMGDSEEDDEPEDIQEQAKTQFEALARIVSWIPLVWPCVVDVESLSTYLETSAMHQYYDA